MSCPFCRALVAVPYSLANYPTNVCMQLRPSAWFALGMFSPSTQQWVDCVHPTRVAVLNRDGFKTPGRMVQASGGGAGAVPCLQGTVDTQVHFGKVLTEKYTICSISRYTGGAQGRILNGAGANMLHGHHAGNAGVAHYNKWLVHDERLPTSTDWVVMCGGNSVGEKCPMFVNGQKHEVHGVECWPQEGLCVNAGDYGNERSDFQVAEVVVFDRHLGVAELEIMSRFLIARLRGCNPASLPHKHNPARGLLLAGDCSVDLQLMRVGFGTESLRRLPDKVSATHSAKLIFGSSNPLSVQTSASEQRRVYRVPDLDIDLEIWEDLPDTLQLSDAPRFVGMDPLGALTPAQVKALPSYPLSLPTGLDRFACRGRCSSTGHDLRSGDPNQTNTAKLSHRSLPDGYVTGLDFTYRYVVGYSGNPNKKTQGPSFRLVVADKDGKESVLYQSPQREARPFCWDAPSHPENYSPPQHVQLSKLCARVDAQSKLKIVFDNGGRIMHLQGGTGQGCHLQLRLTVASPSLGAQGLCEHLGQRFGGAKWQNSFQASDVRKPELDQLLCAAGQWATLKQSRPGVAAPNASLEKQCAPAVEPLAGVKILNNPVVEVWARAGGYIDQIAFKHKDGSITKCGADGGQKIESFFLQQGEYITSVGTADEPGGDRHMVAIQLTTNRGRKSPVWGQARARLVEAKGKPGQAVTGMERAGWCGRLTALTVQEAFFTVDCPPPFKLLTSLCKHQSLHGWQPCSSPASGRLWWARGCTMMCACCCRQACCPGGATRPPR